MKLKQKIGLWVVFILYSLSFKEARRIKNFFSLRNTLQGMIGVWIGCLILVFIIFIITSLISLYSFFLEKPEIKGYPLAFLVIIITFFLLSFIFYHYGFEEGEIQRRLEEYKKEMEETTSEMKE